MGMSKWLTDFADTISGFKGLKKEAASPEALKAQEAEYMKKMAEKVKPHLRIGTGSVPEGRRMEFGSSLKGGFTCSVPAPKDASRKPVDILSAVAEAEAKYGIRLTATEFEAVSNSIRADGVEKKGAEKLSGAVDRLVQYAAQARIGRSIRESNSSVKPTFREGKYADLEQMTDRKRPTPQQELENLRQIRPDYPKDKDPRVDEMKKQNAEESATQADIKKQERSDRTEGIKAASLKKKAENEKPRNWKVRVYDPKGEVHSSWVIENRTENEAEGEAAADLPAEYDDGWDWSMVPEGEEKEASLKKKAEDEDFRAKVLDLKDEAYQYFDNAKISPDRDDVIEYIATEMADSYGGYDAVAKKLEEFFGDDGDDKKASLKTAFKGPIDDDEIRQWILNDEGLYNWAKSEGVPEDELGEEDSEKYKNFVNENRQELVSAIEGALNKKPTASLKTAEDESKVTKPVEIKKPEKGVTLKRLLKKSPDITEKPIEEAPKDIGELMKAMDVDIIAEQKVRAELEKALKEVKDAADKWAKAEGEKRGVPGLKEEVESRQDIRIKDMENFVDKMWQNLPLDKMLAYKDLLMTAEEMEPNLDAKDYAAIVDRIAEMHPKLKAEIDDLKQAFISEKPAERRLFIFPKKESSYRKLAEIEGDLEAKANAMEKWLDFCEDFDGEVADIEEDLAKAAEGAGEDEGLELEPMPVAAGLTQGDVVVGRLDGTVAILTKDFGKMARIESPNGDVKIVDKEVLAQDYRKADPFETKIALSKKGWFIPLYKVKEDIENLERTYGVKITEDHKTGKWTVDDNGGVSEFDSLKDVMDFFGGIEAPVDTATAKTAEAVDPGWQKIWDLDKKIKEARERFEEYRASGDSLKVQHTEHEIQSYQDAMMKLLNPDIPEEQWDRYFRDEEHKEMMERYQPRAKTAEKGRPNDIDRCRDCAYYESGIGTVYHKCAECKRAYTESEIKGMDKADKDLLRDYFTDRGVTQVQNEGSDNNTPTYEKKHASLNKSAGKKYYEGVIHPAPSGFGMYQVDRDDEKWDDSDDLRDAMFEGEPNLIQEKDFKAEGIEDISGNIQGFRAGERLIELLALKGEHDNIMYYGIFESETDDDNPPDQAHELREMVKRKKEEEEGEEKHAGMDRAGLFGTDRWLRDYKDFEDMLHLTVGKRPWKRLSLQDREDLIDRLYDIEPGDRSPENILGTAEDFLKERGYLPSSESESKSVEPAIVANLMNRYRRCIASWKSTKPPKAWWNEKVKEVKKGNPDYTEEQVSKTVGSIWSKLSDDKKKTIRGREGKEYGTPKK